MAGSVHIEDRAAARTEDGRFAVGNKAWRARSSHGRKPKFARTEEGQGKLWSACCEYFDWVEENPLLAAESVKYEGKGTIMTVPKMRAMTIEGLCDFIDIDPSTWRQWKEDGEDGRPDLIAVITRAERIIERQKFEGAAAGMLNATIISRHLGLADKTDHTSSDGSMTPQQTIYQLPDNGRSG